MSFNIRFGTADDGDNRWALRKSSTFSVIRHWQPDIVGLQEVLAMQFDELVKEFPDYEMVGTGRDDGQRAGEMTAVMVKRERWELAAHGHFWLSQTPDVVASKGWDAALPRMATWLHLVERKGANRCELAVINTHLDHMGAESRRQSALLLKARAESISAGRPSLLLGDFNSADGSAPHRALLAPDSKNRLRWRDACETGLSGTDRNLGTFHGFDAERLWGPRIDWILCSQHFQVCDARIDQSRPHGRWPSDHCPVIADVAVGPEWPVAAD